MLKKAKLAAIEMDTSIQCRAAIDTSVVTDYAERMAAGDEFPDVILFGDDDGRLHIGDGWHRIMAARQNGAATIGADIRKGGRQDALKHALGANALHGHRRTNADKRRCVEIALAEFGGLSSRAIAEMCGVSNVFVSHIKPQVLTVNTSTEAPASSPTVTGSDGKSYPAKRTAPPPQQEVAGAAPKEMVTDPLDGETRKTPKVAEVYTSETMVGLKRYWRLATKKERAAFIKWTENYEN